ASRSPRRPRRGAIRGRRQDRAPAKERLPDVAGPAPTPRQASAAPTTRRLRPSGPSSHSHPRKSDNTECLPVTKAAPPPLRRPGSLRIAATPADSSDVRIAAATLLCLSLVALTASAAPGTVKRCNLRWRLVPSPRISDVSLSDVAALRPNLVWAAGSGFNV